MYADVWDSPGKYAKKIYYFVEQLSQPSKTQEERFHFEKIDKSCAIGNIYLKLQNCPHPYL